MTMAVHDQHPHPAPRTPFSELMAEVIAADAATATATVATATAVAATADRFAHREHVHLTWLAVRRYGTAAAIDLIGNGIQSVTRYAGAPQKYNATVSRAWVELVGHHVAHSDAADFDTFVARNPALLDKRLLVRFYRPATLASARARAGWVGPDRAPFPWNAADA
jgi:hypothetical protein